MTQERRAGKQAGRQVVVCRDPSAIREQVRLPGVLRDRLVDEVQFARAVAASEVSAAIVAPDAATSSLAAFLRSRRALGDILPVVDLCVVAPAGGAVVPDWADASVHVNRSYTDLPDVIRRTMISAVQTRAAAELRRVHAPRHPVDLVLCDLPSRAKPLVSVEEVCALADCDEKTVDRHLGRMMYGYVGHDGAGELRCADYVRTTLVLQALFVKRHALSWDSVAHRVGADARRLRNNADRYFGHPLGVLALEPELAVYAFQYGVLNRLGVRLRLSGA